MSILYPAASGAVNVQTCFATSSDVTNQTPRPLSSGAASLLRWLCRWHQQTGDLHPSTRYLAKKQGRTERTIYRWLAECKQAGYLASDVEPGCTRWLTPLVSSSVVAPKVSTNRCKNSAPGRSVASGSDIQVLPAPVFSDGRLGGSFPRMDSVTPIGKNREKRVSVKASDTGKTGTGEADKNSALYETVRNSQGSELAIVSPDLSGVMSGVMSGVSPYRSDASDALTHETTTAQEERSEVAGACVVALCAKGVSKAVAVSLVAQHGEETCSEQVQALAYRRADEPAAVLVASIRGNWPVPVALERERQARKVADQKAQKAAHRAVLASHREKIRAEQLARLRGLPAVAYEHLRVQAVALWQQEQPAAARIMGTGRAGVAIVEGYMMRLLDSLEGG